MVQCQLYVQPINPLMPTLTSSVVWNFDPKADGPVASKWALFHFGVSIAMTLAIFIAWRNDSLARKKKRSKGPKRKSKRKNTTRWTGKVIRKFKRTTAQVEEGDAESADDNDYDDDEENDNREKDPSPWDSLRQRIVPLAQRRKHSTTGGGEIAKMMRKTAPKKDSKTIAEKTIAEENVATTTGTP